MDGRKGYIDLHSTLIKYKVQEGILTQDDIDDLHSTLIKYKVEEINEILKKELFTFHSD